VIIMSRLLALTAMALTLAVASPGHAQTAAPAAPAFDEALAKSTGADDHGMRSYVLVILKTGPTKVPAGPERDTMFKGHMANITRLSQAGKLVLAGPFQSDGSDGWRGLFVFAVPDVEEAKQLVATDPVIQKGEMIAEYHKWYGSAGVMLIPEAHKKLAKQSF
jgi:uncharacterized protein YciI